MRKLGQVLGISEPLYRITDRFSQRSRVVTKLAPGFDTANVRIAGKHFNGIGGKARFYLCHAIEDRCKKGGKTRDLCRYLYSGKVCTAYLLDNIK